MASDRRPYVRIPDAVLREPWDDSTLADMVRLQLWLNTRWARLRLSAEEAGRAFLGPQDMMTVTHTQRPQRARERLLGLPSRTSGVTLRVTEAARGRSRGVNVEWPKFPKEQGYLDRARPNLGGNSGQSRPSASASATAYKKEAHLRAVKRETRTSTYREPPNTSSPQSDYQRLSKAALDALQAEQPGTYSAAQVEERMREQGWVGEPA